MLANCLHELMMKRLQMKRLQSLRDHSRMELLEFFGSFCRTAAQKDEKTSSCQLYTKGATLEFSAALQPAELQKIVRLTQQLPESTGKHDASFLDFLPVMRR